MKVFLYSVKCYFRRYNGKFNLSYRTYDYISKIRLRLGDYVAMNNAYGIITGIKGEVNYDDLVQEKGPNYYKFVSKIDQREFEEAVTNQEELPF